MSKTVRISEQTWRKVESLLHSERAAATHIPPNRREATVVRVLNDSGSAVPRYGILGISGVPAQLSEDAFLQDIILTGKTPAMTAHSGGRFVICIEPIAAGAIGLAVASGVCQVAITVSDQAHHFADIIDGQTGTLKSSVSGPCRILYKQAGTGTRLAVVRHGTQQVRDVQWFEITHLQGNNVFGFFRQFTEFGHTHWDEGDVYSPNIRPDPEATGWPLGEFPRWDENNEYSAWLPGNFSEFQYVRHGDSFDRYWRCVVFDGPRVTDEPGYTSIDWVPARWRMYPPPPRYEERPQFFFYDIGQVVPVTWAFDSQGRLKVLSLDIYVEDRSFSGYVKTKTDTLHIAQTLPCWLGWNPVGATVYNHDTTYHRMNRDIVSYANQYWRPLRNNLHGTTPGSGIHAWTPIKTVNVTPKFIGNGFIETSKPVLDVGAHVLFRRSFVSKNPGWAWQYETDLTFIQDNYWQKT